MAGLGLRPVSDTSDRPGQQADWAGRGLRVSNRVGLGGVCLGGLLVGLGLKLVSATTLRSHGWVAGCQAG